MEAALQKEINELADNLSKLVTQRDECHDKIQDLDFHESGIETRNYLNACKQIAQLKTQADRLGVTHNYFKAFQKDPSSLPVNLSVIRDLWSSPDGYDISLIEGGASECIVNAIRLLHLCGITSPEIGNHPHIHRFKENEPFPQLWQQWTNIFNRLIRTTEEQLEKTKSNWSPLLSLDRLCRIFGVNGTPISKKTLSRRISKGEIQVCRTSTTRAKSIRIQDLPQKWKDIE